MSRMFIRLFSVLLAMALVGCGGSPQSTAVRNSPPPAVETSSSGLASSEAAEGSATAEPSTGGVLAPAIEPAQEGISSGTCVERYSPENLKDRAFAFDGTITAIELRDDPVVADEGEGETATLPWVTFKVNQWYKGGSGSEMSVWMQGIQTSGTTSSITSNGTISADVGTRLLVAGEAIGIGNNPEQGVAWSCGFTQPYTADAAAEWQSATK